MKHILGGIVVIDFSQVIAGPACTRLMAELGAEVIKVELAPAGDPARLLPMAQGLVSCFHLYMFYFLSTVANVNLQ